MPITAKSFMTHTANSRETGRTTAQHVVESFDGSPSLILTYLTVNHDQAGFLAGMREVLGPSIPVIGCSTQGVVARGCVREEGYASGAMALGGAGLGVAEAAVPEIATDPIAKGRELGRALRGQLERAPKVVVLHYDAFGGADPDKFLEGLFREVECPIVGGAAAHSFSYQALRETYLYRGIEVTTRGAVAFALDGDFSIEIGHCHGCSPSGVELEVTRADGNVLLELDGRRAADVWEEICGDVSVTSGQVTALAIGVPRAGSKEYFVRSAYALDPDSGGVVLGPAIPEGTRIMLHHRTVEDVLEGAREMGRTTLERLGPRQARAILGFECGARTRPFLGDEATLSENLALQAQFAGEPSWLGMLPWGELVPIDGRPAFHNYAYSLLVLADP